MTTKTISGHEVRNLIWHNEGIKGYYGEVFKHGEWMMFMWNADGETGNPGFNINPKQLGTVYSSLMEEAYEVGFEYQNQYPGPIRTNDESKQHYSRLRILQLHYNPSQATAFSVGMRDAAHGQKIQWDAFFNACKELDRLLSAVQPLGSLSVWEFRGGWWDITGEETQEQLEQIANDYISFCEVETEAAKIDLRYEN